MFSKGFEFFKATVLIENWLQLGPPGWEWVRVNCILCSLYGVLDEKLAERGWGQLYLAGLVLALWCGQFQGNTWLISAAEARRKGEQQPPPPQLFLHKQGKVMQVTSVVDCGGDKRVTDLGCLLFHGRHFLQSTMDASCIDPLPALIYRNHLRAGAPSLGQAVSIQLKVLHRNCVWSSFDRSTVKALFVCVQRWQW